METEAIRQLNAQVNLHNRLLQHLCATVFHGDADSFGVLMDEMAAELASTSRKAEPSTEEQVEDLKVRIAVHLVRFRQSTFEML